MYMYVPVMTEILKVQLAELPLASVKVYVTSVFPTKKLSPGLLVLLWRKTVPELSVAVASAKFTATKGVPSWTVTVMSAGQSTTGGVVSTTKCNKKGGQN